MQVVLPALVLVKESKIGIQTALYVLSATFKHIKFAPLINSLAMVLVSWKIPKAF